MPFHAKLVVVGMDLQLHWKTIYNVRIVNSQCSGDGIVFGADCEGGGVGKDCGKPGTGQDGDLGLWL